MDNFPKSSSTERHVADKRSCFSWLSLPRPLRPHDSVTRVNLLSATLDASGTHLHGCFRIPSCIYTRGSLASFGPQKKRHWAQFTWSPFWEVKIAVLISLFSINNFFFIWNCDMHAVVYNWAISVEKVLSDCCQFLYFWQFLSCKSEFLLFYASAFSWWKKIQSICYGYESWHFRITVYWKNIVVASCCHCTSEILTIITISS